jgi:hypothetical protein
MKDGKPFVLIVNHASQGGLAGELIQAGAHVVHSMCYGYTYGETKGYIRTSDSTCEEFGTYREVAWTEMIEDLSEVDIIVMSDCLRDWSFTDDISGSSLVRELRQVRGYKGIILASERYLGLEEEKLMLEAGANGTMNCVQDIVRNFPRPS